MLRLRGGPNATPNPSLELTELNGTSVPSCVARSLEKMRSARRAWEHLQCLQGTEYLLSPERRTLDKAMCVAMAPFAGVVSLAAAGVTYRNDGAPVIHHAKRVGQNNVPFDMLKIRTMYENADALLPPELENRRYGIIPNDPRLIRGARLLRPGFDELPQIVNIWRGEMSWWGLRAIEVGERDLWQRRWPDRPEEFDEWMSVRHIARPAIFGYDGGRRRRGEGFTADTLPERRDLDCLYINEGASLETDIRVMVDDLSAVICYRSSREAAPLQPGDLEV